MEQLEQDNIQNSAELLQQEQAIDEAILNSQEGQETLVAQHGAITESNNLENEIRAQEATPQVLSNREMQKVVDNATLRMVANERIEKCDDLRSWIQSTEWSGKSKSELREKIWRAIKDMKKMVKDINRLEKRGQLYSNTGTYKNRLWEIIFNYYSSWEPARQIIVMWWRVPMIRWTVDSMRDAEKDNGYAINNAEDQIDFSALSQNTALYTMVWVSAREWWDYCNFLAQWWVATGHPVFVQNTAGFNNIKAYNPDLYRALTPEWQITYDTYCQRNPNLYPMYCSNNYVMNDTFNNKIWTWLADIAERIGLNKDHDPRKRQAWEKAGSIAALGWAVVLWFQFLKNLFSSKTKNPDKWRNAWLYWWWLLALLNLDKITNWAQDITWWHPAEKTRMLAETFNKYSFSDAQAMEIADVYVSAPVTTMSALHFIPIYELESQHILEDKNGDFEFNYDNYEKYVNKYAWDNNQKEQVLKAWQQLRDKKCAWAWLRAFWIATRDKLRSLFGSDKNKTLAQTKEVQDWWENMVERVRSWVNKELYNHWLKAKNPEAINTIMSEYGDWQKSKEEVNKLILDWMKRGLLELTSEDGNYTIEEMLTKPEYTSQLNLEEMTMNWFKNWANEVKFTSYGELFETVYITEKIKYIFKWRTDALDVAPFHVNAIWQIEFNNREWYELHKTDTTVISLKKLKTDLPTIKNNVDAYNDYLNKWWLSQIWT